MKPRLEPRLARIVAAGVLILSAARAFAGEDVAGAPIVTSAVGGTPGALLRAGIGPSGHVDTPLVWRRAPAAASTNAVAAVQPDARSLRGGAHDVPIEVASQDVRTPGAD